MAIADQSQFPIKIGTKEELDLYVQRLTHGEKQVLLEYNGNQYLSVGDGTYIPVSEVSNIGLSNKVGDIQDVTLPSELIGKSLVEMIKINFTNANDAKSNLIDIIGDISLAETDTFSELLNSLLSKKQSILTALINKQIIGLTIDDDLATYATAIDNISIGNTTNVKLNMTANSIHQEVLNTPITDLTELCTSVLKYIPGDTNVVEYTCTFDNTDSANFNHPDTVDFDGSMHLLDRSETHEYDSSTTLSDGTLNEAAVDTTNFYTVDRIETNETGYTVIGTNFPAMVKAIGDINITNVLTLNQIILDATISGGGMLKVLISFDSGITWLSYNGTLWEVVDINDPVDVKANAMNVTTINSLNSTALQAGRNDSNKIRFAYYLEKNNISDVASNNNIQLVVNMKGKDDIAPQSDFSYKLESDMQTITYTINTAGTYTFVYVDK